MNGIEVALERLAQMQITTQQQLDQMGQRIELFTSEMRSSISTLADMVEIHEQQIEQLIQNQEASRQLHDDLAQRFERHVERSEQDRALMLQLIQQLAQGRNGGN